ncbi:hypothetical protein PUN71_022180 [Arthrobacter sp. NQ7]|uniref:hypothetical protein n=1 Tax=Arthrobacter sp. NQ7 TaxID=3032303 RepID=UPI00240F74C3|nr:hypothetical protein [Arthrobacter sp. NQ7]MDJ0459919.1 hypothetical protein [Arthrobacter sp. NQ7]
MLDPDEQDEARFAVYERDESDPLKDLLRNTHSQLLRTSLGRPVERLKESRWTSGQRLDEDGFAARHDAVANLLTEAGVEVDAPGVREAIEQLVTEGPYDWHEGVQLDVLWYGDVADAVPSTRSDNDPEAGKEKVLEFAKPHVLLIDKWNGQGYDTVLPAPLKIPRRFGRRILLGRRLRAREVRLRRRRSTESHLGLRPG